MLSVKIFFTLPILVPLKLKLFYDCERVKFLLIFCSHDDWTYLIRWRAVTPFSVVDEFDIFWCFFATFWRFSNFSNNANICRCWWHLKLNKNSLYVKLWKECNSAIKKHWRSDKTVSPNLFHNQSNELFNGQTLTKVFAQVVLFLESIWENWCNTCMERFQFVWCCANSGNQPAPTRYQF